MSDTLRRTSEQYATRLESIDKNISDAKENIKKWETEKAEVADAKALIDSKLPKTPSKPAANA